MANRIIKTVPLILAAFCLCSCSFISEDKTEIANPWIEYSTLHDAKQSGLFLLPNAPSTLLSKSLNYIAILNDGNISEVQYGDGDIVIRKGFKQENVSGDYNDYVETTTEPISDKQVTLKSATGSGQYNLAEWNEGLKYSCSVYSESGFTCEQLQEIMADVF